MNLFSSYWYWYRFERYWWWYRHRLWWAYQYQYRLNDNFHIGLSLTFVQKFYKKPNSDWGWKFAFLMSEKSRLKSRLKRFSLIWRDQDWCLKNTHNVWCFKFPPWTISLADLIKCKITGSVLEQDSLGTPPPHPPTPLQNCAFKIHICIYS